MKKISTALVTTAAFVAVLMYFGIAGMDRQEVMDCQQLQSESTEFSHFFLTKWQDQMCRAHSIFINAPIK